MLFRSVGFGITRRTWRTYPIVEIQWHSFSTLKIRNLRRRYLGILDDGKVRHGILTRMYWEYSSRLRKKLGKGKYLFSLPIWENHFFIFLSCIFVNYKYLPEKRGGGDFLLRLYLRLRETDSREKL